MICPAITLAAMLEFPKYVNLGLEEGRGAANHAVNILDRRRRTGLYIGFRLQVGNGLTLGIAPRCTWSSEG